MKIIWVVLFLFLFLVVCTTINAKHISYLPYGYQMIEDTGGITDHLLISFREQGGSVYCDVVKKDDGFDWSNYTNFPCRVLENNGYIRYPDEEWIPQWDQIYYFEVDLSKKDAYTFRIPRWFNVEDYRIKIGYGTATYNGGTNLITVTQGTPASPVTMMDVYNADVAGGWGVVTKQGTNSFYINANLQIGDGATSTFFVSQNESVFLEGTFGTTANSDTRFGIWLNDHAHNGAFWFFNKTYGTTVYWYMNGNFSVYGTTLMAKKQTGTTNRIYFAVHQNANVVRYNESMFQQWRGVRFYNTNGNIFMNQVYQYTDASNYGYYFSTPVNNTLYDIRTTARMTNNYLGAVAVNVYEATIHDTAELYSIYLYSASDVYIKRFEFINPIVIDSGSWGVAYIEGTANASSLVRINYTFDFKMVNETGAGIPGYDVICINHTGYEMVNETTQADGTINTSMLPDRVWIGPQPNPASLHLETNNPYTMYVYDATDTLFYECIFNVSEPINWTLNETSGGGTLDYIIPYDNTWPMVIIGTMFAVSMIIILDETQKKGRKKK